MDNQYPYLLNGWKCRASGTVGHKALMCRIKKSTPNSRPREQTAKQEKHLEAAAEEDDFLTVMSVYATPGRQLSFEFRLDVRLNGIFLTMKLDTGAEASVAPKSVWSLLGCPLLEDAPRLRAYGGANLPLLGQAFVAVLLHGKSKRLPLIFRRLTRPYHYSVCRGSELLALSTCVLSLPSRGSTHC